MPLTPVSGRILHFTSAAGPPAGPLTADRPLLAADYTNGELCVVDGEDIVVVYCLSSTSISAINFLTPGVGQSILTTGDDVWVTGETAANTGWSSQEIPVASSGSIGQTYTFVTRMRFPGLSVITEYRENQVNTVRGARTLVRTLDGVALYSTQTGQPQSDLEVVRNSEDHCTVTGVGEDSNAAGQYRIYKAMQYESRIEPSCTGT